MVHRVERRGRDNQRITGFDFLACSHRTDPSLNHHRAIKCSEDPLGPFAVVLSNATRELYIALIDNPENVLHDWVSAVGEIVGGLDYLTIRNHATAVF